MCRRAAVTVVAVLTGMSGGGTWAAAPPKPATVAQAAQVLNLAEFPLLEGAQPTDSRRVAQLAYNASGKVRAAFDFQAKQLVDRKWQEIPEGRYVSDETASSTFARDGYTVTVSVFAGSEPGTVRVTLSNHGNVALQQLPVPPGTKPFYSGPVNAAHITAAPVAETAATCRKLLLAAGWQPYGTAGETQFFKQNAVRLAARVAAAPAQGGKTVIDFMSELMSVDLPAPAETEGLQYSDSTTQLLFDTTATMDEVVAFYRQSLAAANWQATTEATLKIDFKNALIFRNPAHDMLTLEMYPVDDKLRVVLTHQTAAELAEIERQRAAAAERKRMEKSKPQPQIALSPPTDAQNIERTRQRLEFTIAAGKAQTLVESWRKRFKEAGWKETTATLEAMFGTVSLTKDGQSLSITYVDAGFMPAEIDVSASGADLVIEPPEKE